MVFPWLRRVPEIALPGRWGAAARDPHRLAGGVYDFRGGEGGAEKVGRVGFGSSCGRYCGVGPGLSVGGRYVGAARGLGSKTGF